MLNFKENKDEYFNILINNQSERKCFIFYIFYKQSLRRINIWLKNIDEIIIEIE